MPLLLPADTHPAVLQWIAVECLNFLLRAAFLRLSPEAFLRLVNRTDCYPCRVEWGDGRPLQIYVPDMTEEPYGLFD